MYPKPKLSRSLLLTGIGITVGFALLPADQQTDDLTWLIIASISFSTIYLSLAWRRHLSRWRGWLSVVGGLFIGLEWLRVQWFATTPVVEKITIVVALWSWALCIAVFISSVLMLIYRGASVVFMGLAWLGLPITLLTMGLIYKTSALMDSAPLNDKLLAGVSIWWIICIGGLSLPVFLIQMFLLARKEIVEH